MTHTQIPPAPKPTEQQIAMCKAECGPMGNTGFHSLLCPLSGVDHPSRPGNTFKRETIEQEKERVFGTCGGKCGEAPCVEWNKAHGRYLGLDDERTAIGNTPTCEDCGKATGNCVCDADAIALNTLW